jgi:hypothetical protein
VVTEAQLQQAVIELARLLGYRVAHFRPAKTERGWRTPVEADGKGFPDLVLAKPNRLVFVELKAAKGKVSDEQKDWLATLGSTGAEAYIFRPEGWSSGAIEKCLRG